MEHKTYQQYQINTEKWKFKELVLRSMTNMMPKVVKQQSKEILL